MSEASSCRLGSVRLRKAVMPVSGTAAAPLLPLLPCAFFLLSLAAAGRTKREEEKRGLSRSSGLMSSSSQ